MVRHFDNEAGAFLLSASVGVAVGVGVGGSAVATTAAVADPGRD